jgi:spermidine synthase
MKTRPKLALMAICPYNHRVKHKAVSTPPSGPTADAGLTAGLRRYLYGTAATTGAMIMIVEILGARMLSPFVGTSHFVWTAQIAVTLVALACGYYAGGLLVDRSLRLGRLYAAILAAGVYLALTVGATRSVAYACLSFSLPVGSLLCSAILFFVPLALLAMVCPFFARVLTQSVSGVGGNVGRLTSISTLGSFIGTLLIGYVLVPLMPNSTTMYIVGGLLAGLALVYFLVWGRSNNQRIAAGVAMALGLGGGYLGAQAEPLHSSGFEELFRGNSHFGQLEVLQAKGTGKRFYLNDYLIQNTYDADSGKSSSMFTWMLHGLAHAYTPKIDRALCIGVGVGIVPMQFVKEGIAVDAVEINPAVVPVAQKFFGFQPDKVNLIFGDGREFLNRCTNRYDVVALDAFLGDSSPSHLLTREAFSAIRAVLRTNGTLVINSFAHLDWDRDYFAASLSKTLSAVFPSVRIHSNGSGNTLFVASLRTDAQMLSEPDFSAVPQSCQREVERAFAGLHDTDPKHGRVLTDDFNPLEFFDASNREHFRRQMAESLKDL